LLSDDGVTDSNFKQPKGMIPLFVMAGLVPAIHVLLVQPGTWMPGTRPGMTTKSNTRLHSRDVICPSSALHVPPSEIRGRRECRALDAPAASHAVCETKHTSIVTTVTPETPGIPRAMVLRFPSCSPRRTKPASHRRHRHWVSRTTRLLRPRQRARLAHRPRPSHPAHNVRDDRETPLM
jgi:hypothetical protein